MLEITKAEKSFRVRCKGRLLAPVGFMTFLLEKTTDHLGHEQSLDGYEASHEVT